MIDYIHKRNAHIMISVWASFGPWTEMYHKMDSLNALLHFETWPPKAGVKPRSVQSCSKKYLLE